MSQGQSKALVTDGPTSKATRDGVVAVAKTIDERVSVFGKESAHASETTLAFHIATCVADLRAIMKTPDCIALLRRLYGTPLGFLCDRPNDKDRTAYSDDELVTCCTEALIRGFRLTGNEFNIIAGRFYGALEGYRRKVFGLPGLEKFDPEYTVPVLLPNGDSRLAVTCKAEFVWKGERVTMVRTVAVKGAPDAVAGKAERRFLKAVYTKLTNQWDASGDLDGDPATGDGGRVETGDSKTGQLADKLGAKTPELPPAEVKTTVPDVPVETVTATDAKPDGKPVKSIFAGIEDEDEYARAASREDQRRRHENTK